MGSREADEKQVAGQGRARTRLLFFSGGTALRETARELCRSAADSIHLVTPFDSGGSSADLRRAFGMPAVGDARSRVLALADVSLPGNDAAATLLAYRLPRETGRAALQVELGTLVRGRHPLARPVPPEQLSIIQRHLQIFSSRMPEDFPLAGASMGNLVLAAAYLENGGAAEDAVSLLSDLVGARGVVRLAAEQPAHLAVRLASGEVVVGQHRFTGKENGGVASPVADIWLTGSEDSPEPLSVAAAPCAVALIRQAGAICYPIGSFYSSVVANLLPSGMGRAVAENGGPKIFVPNPGADPELAGHSLQTQVEHLLRPLQADAPGAGADRFLTHLLIDRASGTYGGGVPDAWLAAQGIAVVDVPFLGSSGRVAVDPRLLVAALGTIARGV